MGRDVRGVGDEAGCGRTEQEAEEGDRNWMCYGDEKEEQLAGDEGQSR